MIDHAIEDARTKSTAELEECERGTGGEPCAACRAALDELEALPELTRLQHDERAEAHRLYWEHREQGHYVEPVSGCPICDDAVRGIEEALGSGAAP